MSTDLHPCYRLVCVFNPCACLVLQLHIARVCRFPVGLHLTPSSEMFREMLGRKDSASWFSWLGLSLAAYLTADFVLNVATMSPELTVSCVGLNATPSRGASCTKQTMAWQAAGSAALLTAPSLSGHACCWSRVGAGTTGPSWGAQHIVQNPWFAREEGTESGGLGGRHMAGEVLQREKKKGFVFPLLQPMIKSPRGLTV